MLSALNTSGIRAVVLIISLATAGGCISNDDESIIPDDSPVATEPLPPAPTTPVRFPHGANSEADQELPRFLAASLCQGAGTSFSWPWSLGPFPNPPKGWESGPVLTNTVVLNFYRCERFHWGNFERGPFDFLMELQDYANPPEGCKSEEVNLHLTLQALWISDSEIASFAEQTYGLPVHLAKFQWNTTYQGDVVQHRLAWSSESQPASHLTWSSIDDASFARQTTNRFYWFNESSVSFMDFEETIALPQNQFIPQSGELQPPTLYAQGITKTYLGIGTHYWNGELFANFHQFSDLQCTEPL